jgi:NAD(P)-dependent dehydrogenase (short-subunit alcohol dehydrogenase family)
MGMETLKMLFGLEGKTALVTGSGRGIGRGMALALARAGADLALVSRTEKELKEVEAEVCGIDGGRRVLLIPADLTAPGSVQAVVDRVVSAFGRIDILFNNAGRNIRVSAEAFTAEEWDSVMNVNLRAGFLLAQAVGKVMIRQGGGKIINTASLTSFIGLPNMVAYVASRGGVKQMTQALAVEWARFGVTVNAIAPGYILTKQTERLLEDPERKAWILSKIPMGRVGEPERDLTGAVIFLASAASDYMTGQTLIIDGGWMAG